MLVYESILRYIEANLQSKIGIEALARHVGYSKYHFCRLFKETTGQSVGTFIQRRRLLKVLQALCRGESAANVIHDYGFDTYAGFYKAFIRMFGCNPKAYVEAHREVIPLHIMEEKLMEQYKTQRCVLTHLREADIPDAIRLLTEPQVRAHLGGVLTEDAAVSRLKEWIAADDSVHYAVRHAETGALMGILAVAPHHNLIDKEISYQFLPEYWGNGYAYETIGWLLVHCKDELHIETVVSETQSANERSCRLLKKLGYEEQEKLVRFGSEQTIFRKQL